jgi:DNA-binding transcriptional MocR family regulator
MSRESADSILEELIAGQRKKIAELARRIDPTLVEDDLLQPHDHPRLASHAGFQFEDGILAGLLSARAALRSRSTI